jgi:hypothetical protein
MKEFLPDCECEEVKVCQERDCVECDIPLFERNNYFCGKLMVERDFWCDQRYHMGKQRRHNKNAHGWGTLCGLKVVQHPVEECRDQYVVLKPGAALDCCGREIVVREEQLIELPLKLVQKAAGNSSGDFTEVFEKFPELKVWAGGAAKTIYIAIKYRECYTEPVPSLFSECGCVERCEPNRIKETSEIRLLTEDELGEVPPEYTEGGPPLDASKPCNEIYKEVVEEGCPDCPPEPLNHWVILASIKDYKLEDKVTDSEIDNLTHRRLVPSTE